MEVNGDGFLGAPTSGGRPVRGRSVVVGTLEATASTGRRCSYGAARLLRGPPASSEEDDSLLHTNSKERDLEVRRDMRDRVERSRGREGDGVDRKQRNSVARRAAPASNQGSLGAWCLCLNGGNEQGGQGLLIGGLGWRFCVLTRGFKRGCKGASMAFKTFDDVEDAGGVCAR